jgi:cytidine deaminase
MTTVNAATLELFEAARAAQAFSYSPYSHYKVGAALRTASGRVFAACNVENAAYPQSSCAEASAISMMIAAGEREIVEVVTVCDGEMIGTCCGGCRQRIREFAGPDTPIHAAGPDGIRATFTMAELLPHSFGPEHLLGT